MKTRTNKQKPYAAWMSDRDLIMSLGQHACVMQCQDINDTLTSIVDSETKLYRFRSQDHRSMWRAYRFLRLSLTWHRRNP